MKDGIRIWDTALSLPLVGKRTEGYKETRNILSNGLKCFYCHYYYYYYSTLPKSKDV